MNTLLIWDYCDPNFSYLVIAAAVCASMTNTPIAVTVVSDKTPLDSKSVVSQRRRLADIPTGIAFYGETSLIGNDYFLSDL